MFRHAPFAPLAFLALLAWPAAHAETCLPTQETPLHLALETPAAKPGARAIGNGEHRYRFTVRDPQRPEQPFRNGNYRIELPDGTLFPDGTRFYSGRADVAGRTAVFAFPHPLAVDHVLVQPRVGEDRFGQSFRISICGPFEDLDPVANRAYLEMINDAADRPYLIDIAAGPIFCGKTLPGGHTARFETKQPATLTLHTLDARACRTLQRALGQALAAPAWTTRMRHLQQLHDAPGLDDTQRGIVAARHEAELLRHGSPAQIDAWLSRENANAAPEARRTRLNNTAYTLLAQHPARHLRYAESLIDAALELGEDGALADTKAWARHLQGYDAEALDWANRALVHFSRTCTAPQAPEIIEALAHRGMILWTLQRRLEALDDWALASAATEDGSWTLFIPDWQRIEALITLRRERLGLGATPPDLCARVLPQS